jgi:thiopeptide-type bacteriocin biosynthesis protein
MRTSPRKDAAHTPLAEVPVPPTFVEEATGLGVWEQVNLALSACAGSFRESSWPLLEQLQALLQIWRRAAPVECWFVRKPPGIRLRLSGPGFGTEAHNGFVALLDREVTQGNLERWWSSTYEPETYRLGGPAALAAMHNLFSADTTVWLGWESLSRRGSARLSEDLMALALYGDLLLRATEASEEAWDVWCALHWIYAGALPEEPSEPPTRRHLLLPQGLYRLANEAERSLLDHGFAANEKFARALEQIWERGELVGGRRALLATLASFHWNIWCLPPHVVAPLCQAMVRELHPAAAFLPPVRPSSEV